ncbi:hypothetical protein MJO28_011165 [Puccinia striiformis f. sp. tritici]|uniref:Uncharacterized protein n=1 Tax=Puccinia striiformis f. sp. tritici TaxID=168172 RepID=A0ACC0E1V2_9BASI|nr:hypothetical protein MJO28_011165 [Puccinia striiformis f. sp. tritici]
MEHTLLHDFLHDSVLDQLPIKHRKLDEECMSMYSTASNNLTLNLTRFDPNHGHQTQFRQRCIYHCSITSRASPFTTVSRFLSLCLWIIV